jgi:DNA-binding NtrC family response regulator
MASRGRILIVDDEANARAALSEILHEVKMPGLDGIGLMEKGREIAPAAVFVVMTAFGTIGSAVDAVKRGAENYLTKPLDFEALVAIVERAMDKARLVKENVKLRERLRERNVMSHIVGDSPKMQKLLGLVEQVAKSRASVLIVGESGTGKELIAEAIHRASPRAKAPLVRLNCAALAEGLLESELFGHEKGAFTGALGRREGRFKQADQGTLFLDEVSEIPAATQVKLLRFLQERAFERVGGNETLHVDVRIIAATNRDLKALIDEGRFREDLFYRLNVVSLEIPPLRERVEDVAPLALFFLARYAQENGKRIDGIEPEALALLMAHKWPGNVRELENAMERAVVLCDEPRIDRRHLPANIAPKKELHGPPQIPGSSIDEIERFAILKTLEMCGGSTSKAAAVLGISSRKIQYKLHEYTGLGSGSEGEP